MQMYGQKFIAHNISFPQKLKIAFHYKCVPYSTYTQLQKKAYTFRFFEYSEGRAIQSALDGKGSFLLSTDEITKCILSFGVECSQSGLRSIWG